MAVATGALLQKGLGAGLPHAVREALIDIGIVCNDAALALNAVHVELARAHCARDVLHSGSSGFAWRAQQVNDMAKCVDAHRDRLAVILARSAAWYAVYASQVATQVLRGDPPTPPTGGGMLPSKLIDDAERLLPSITFRVTRASLTDQNNDVAAAREVLFNVIADHRRAGSAVRYDDPYAAEQNARRFAGEATEFPDALLAYASALTWALGVYTGVAASGRA
jgi:hypothetical protein